MIWDVRWSDASLAELLSIWSEPRLAEGRAFAMREFHKRVRRNPLGVGESRGGTRRIEFLLNIAIQFDVRPATTQVLVVGVHRIRNDVI